MPSIRRLWKHSTSIICFCSDQWSPNRVTRYLQVVQQPWTHPISRGKSIVTEGTIAKSNRPDSWNRKAYGSSLYPLWFRGEGVCDSMSCHNSKRNKGTTLGRTIPQTAYVQVRWWLIPTRSYTLVEGSRGDRQNPTSEVAARDHVNHRQDDRKRKRRWEDEGGDGWGVTSVVGSTPGTATPTATRTSRAPHADAAQPCDGHPF